MATRRVMGMIVLAQRNDGFLVPLLRRCWALAFVFCATSAAAIAHSAEEGLEQFEKKIRPVLQQHCYECHSAAAQQAKKLKGGLQLDTREGIRRGGDAGPAVVPGDVAKSVLIAALRHESFEMPPSGKLPAEVIADFIRWVELGAPDPRDAPPSAATAKTIDIAAARKTHWAFQPPRKAPVPAVSPQNEGWPKNDVDRFLLARLEAEGLKPVAPAEPRDLIRRLYFDLIGLPPTPEEIEAFVNDRSADPLAAVVDRLLATPQYGERWGRHWLDVARYSDDQALANARDNPHAWRYRDWVVQALQHDMPYDRFLKLQLAGDLLPELAEDPFLRLAGLGFQGLGQLYHRGNFPEQVMADELDDRIDTVSRGLLGLTVACARCHDHKYDPIPTRDYYSLAAAYQGANWIELPLAPPDTVARHAKSVEEIKQREAAIGEWLKDQGRALSEARLRDLRLYLVESWRLYVKKLHKQPADESATAKEKQISPYFLVRWVRFLEAPDPGRNRERLAAWHAAARLAAGAADPALPAPELPPALTMLTDDLAKHAAALADEFDRVTGLQRAAQAVAKTDEERRKIARPDIADPFKPWHVALIAEGNAPLAINGNDIVAALDDAGRQEHQKRSHEIEQLKKNAPPPPPLAHGVSGGGVAMKVHIRGNVERKGELAPPGFLQVLRSDPEPATASTEAPRFTRRDLAEAIAHPQNPLTARVFVNRIWHHHFGRGLVATPSNFGVLGERPSHPELLDFLAVSFMENGWSMKWLHRQIVLSRTYSLSSKPDSTNMARDVENRLLWRWNPRRLDFEAWRDCVLAVSGRLDRAVGGPSEAVDVSVRRTIYSKVSRSRLDPTLAVFDFPDANVSSEKRSVTTVAQQQLFVLNSPFMIESAKAFAQRLQGAAADDAGRIAAAYRLAFGRGPTDAERDLGLQFLQTASTGTGEALTPWQRYAQAILAANEFAWSP